MCVCLCVCVYACEMLRTHLNNQAEFVHFAANVYTLPKVHIRCICLPPLSFSTNILWPSSPYVYKGSIISILHAVVVNYLASCAHCSGNVAVNCPLSSSLSSCTRSSSHRLSGVADRERPEVPPGCSAGPEGTSTQVGGSS